MVLILGMALAVARPSKKAKIQVDGPPYLIGYSEYRTNLPGGQFGNFSTTRVYLVRGDGTGRRMLAGELVQKPNTWTQFAGWSPGGRQAIIFSGWESPENGAWEEEHQTFRIIEGGVAARHLFARSDRW